MFEAIKNDVNAEPKKVIGLYEGIREARFRNGLACVHCGSLRVKRNGTYRQRQRYLHRKPRKRGGTAQKRGISDEQVSVVVALDRNGAIFSKLAGRGRVTASQISDVMGNLLRGDAVLCTDSATNYKSFAKINNINHEVINIRKDGYVKKGIYHIQHVNRYHGELKYWLKRFDGVATSYLDNYLFWFRFLELNKNQDDKLVSNAILLASCQKPTFTTVSSF